MLQFFKKTGRVEKTPHNTIKRHSVPSSSSSSFNDTILDESLANDYIETTECRSRLSKNLPEIISDKNCLCYFVQFLDMKKSLSLIKFYLDAESFKTAAELSLSSNIQLKLQRNDDNKRDSVSDDFSPMVSSRGVTKSTSSEGYDSLSFSSFDVCDRISISSQSENNLREMNNIAELDDINEDIIEDNFVPELKTLCDLTMRKPLTDDEKSRIYAETNKRSRQNIERCEKDRISTTIVTDAIRIYKKYLISNSQYFIDIPATILSSISLALCAQEIDGKVISSITSNCFDEAQKFILERLEKDYLNEFLESAFYCRYCVDIITGGTLKLSDILYSEAALFYFMEYLEQENIRDYLEFWLTATNFRKHYVNHLDTFNKEEAQNDAMVLYEKYFSLQATCPLRISDSVRCRIEECICTEMNDIIKCFDLPIRIIQKYFELKYFSTFLTSQLFIKYLNELRVKIKDDQNADLSNVIRRQQHRKTRSDCTNDNTKGLRNSFISQQNTLLAMETCRTKVKQQQQQANDMQIDSRQLTNPDLLWHRNSFGGLTFGRVDALGRYERDFELGHTEEKWTLASGGNKIKNAVRKLVNLPEDKVQEEIAWQVAEMIVKDITNITLGKNDKNAG